MPFLTRKCVFYKPGFQVFKCKNKIGAQRVDEKLGSSGENVYGHLKNLI